MHAFACGTPVRTAPCSTGRRARCGKAHPQRFRACARSADAEVVVVGAGLAGLSAASRLAAAGVSVEVLEGSDAVGGRVRSDVVDGFVLDRGFQVFIEAYPEAVRLLDYEALDLHPMAPGALVRHSGGFHAVGDPFRAPLLAARGALSPVGTLADKVRVLALRAYILADRPVPDVSTERFLVDFGFTPRMIDAFFRPFYQGIFLAPLAEQSARMFAYVFRMFANEPASIPADGIGAVTKQLAENLPDDLVRITLGDKARVVEIRDEALRLQGDRVLRAPTVIVAVDGPAAARLLDIPLPQGRGTSCIYFASDNPPPLTEPILMLNGEGDAQGAVNNMFVPSVVCPKLAPPGKTLVSATVIGTKQSDEQLDAEARTHMAKWFGRQTVDEWRTLRTYRIPHAQPAQAPGDKFELPSRVRDGVFVCGDHRNTPTVNGALASGRIAADAALHHVRTRSAAVR